MSKFPAGTTHDDPLRNIW